MDINKIKHYAQSIVNLCDMWTNSIELETLDNNDIIEGIDKYNKILAKELKS